MPSTPPDLDSALSDIYLDRTSSKPKGGLYNTDGWLSPDVQTELDALIEQMNALYELLRASRNLVTHDSDESRSRVKDALNKAAHVDADFQFNQQVTELSVVRWLASNSQKRLRKIAAIMPEIWKAMVAAEGVLRAEVAIRR